MGSRNWLVLAAAAAALAATPSQLPEALKAQRAQAELQPGDPEVLNDLANLLVLSGELREAEETYGRALELAPDRTSTRYNLALLLQQSGRSRDALAEYQRVLDSEPGHAWAHYQLGTLYAATGRRSRALKHYARALTLRPELILPEVNPHIVQNRFATEALLLARQSESPAAFAPRLYQQPTRIAELLVPPVPQTVAPPQPETPTATRQTEPSRSGVRTQWLPASEDEEPEEEAETDERARAVLPGPQRQSAPGAEPSGRRDEVEPPTTGGRPQPRTPPGVIAVTVPPFSVPSTGSTPPPATGQPGLPSTGRLELQLLPSQSELLAGLPRARRPPDHAGG